MFGSNDDEGDAAETDHVGTVSAGRFGADHEVHRVVDEEAGMVVYAMVGGQSAGLDAVPVEETDLADDEWGRRR